MESRSKNRLICTPWSGRRKLARGRDTRGRIRTADYDTLAVRMTMKVRSNSAHNAYVRYFCTAVIEDDKIGTWGAGVGWIQREKHKIYQGGLVKRMLIFESSAGYINDSALHHMYSVYMTMFHQDSDCHIYIDWCRYPDLEAGTCRLLFDKVCILLLYAYSTAVSLQLYYTQFN
jgi:hypothetical protein